MVTVMRLTVGSLVAETVRLSMLKPRRQNRLATRARTPLWLSTSRLMTLRDWFPFAVSSLFHDDVVDIAAAGDHGQHFFVLIDHALDPCGALLLECLGKSSLKLGEISAAVALEAEALGQLDEVGLAVGVGLGEALS